MRNVKQIWLLAVSGTVLLSSGCVSVSLPGNLKNAFHKQNADQMTYAEDVVEVPSKLKHPEELKLAYARYVEDVNQLDEAKAKYLEVLETQPENVQAILGLARIDYAHGMIAEAEKKFHKAIRVAPEFPEAQYELGKFYAAELKWESAVEPLTAAMLAMPDQQEYRFQLAVALVHTGDIGSALPHFIRTVGDAEAHFNVAMILKDEGELELVEKHLLLALMKKPEFEQAKYWLAQVKSLRGNLSSTRPSDSHTQENTPQMPSHFFSSNHGSGHSNQLVQR